jgi:hypothetical protein
MEAWCYIRMLWCYQRLLEVVMGQIAKQVENLEVDRDALLTSLGEERKETRVLRDEVRQLQEKLKDAKRKLLLAIEQNYCTICGKLLRGE